MKQYLAFALSLSVCYSVDARNLNAFFSVNTFYSPEKGPYIETYLNVVGNTVKLSLNDRSKYQSKVEIELTFTQGGVIKYHDKYNLLGPALDDTIGFCPDFIDQQRILMPDGDYDLLLKIRDRFAPDQSITAHYPVKIHYPKDTVTISDIELIDTSGKATEENNFTKSGLTIIPLVSDYYPKKLKTLKFYAEIYNTKTVFKEDPFIIKYYISDEDNRYITNNLASFKRDTAQEVCVILAQLPLNDLYSGNYNLSVEVRNKKNALVALKRIFFQRDNAKQVTQDTGNVHEIDISKTFVAYINHKDSMKAYISCLRPVSTNLEADFEDNQLQNVDLKYMQQFFYDFWLKRNPADPQKAWMDYLAEVKKVEALYATRNSNGYATDRGRVYLQYGPPNSVYKEENEPNAYPYEIWHYYKLGRQTNKKFIFYCREYATNLYMLLHSDAVGELSNPNWLNDLYSRSSQAGSNMNQSATPGQSGGKALEEFNNPK